MGPQLPPDPLRCTLGWAENSVPAGDAGPIARLSEHGLAVEAVYDRELPEPHRYRDLPVISVQAYRVHEAHPLHPDPARRRLARRHIGETVELAAALGARKVVSVCCYGESLQDRPEQRCVDFYASLGAVAKREGVQILLEPLAPSRGPFFHHPDHVQVVLESLDDRACFGLLIDTGHLLETLGWAPEQGSAEAALLAELERADYPIDHMHWKGLGSRAPGPSMPGAAWIPRALARGVRTIAGEHRECLDEEEFGKVVGWASGVLERLGVRGDCQVESQTATQPPAR